MKKTPFKRRSRVLRVKGVSTSAQLKDDIQGLLRQIVIIRDGGCLLSDSTHIAGQCGGYRKDGELILQAEHLHTRANSASFADPRLVICLCKRHHIYWKPQHADEYYRLVKELIGEERTTLLERVQADHKPFHMNSGDWKLCKIALEKQLAAYA